jgi:2-C-methyl-D-erythritol 4-phosphate cytidylyltransferase
MPKFAVILPAAGRSSRFGGLEKKPFVALDGRPVWLRSAELFWTRADVSTVLVVVSADDEELFRARHQGTLAFAGGSLVRGGAERFESVANALANVPDEVEFVAVHDAVRPLCPPPLIDAVFAAAVTHGAAMLAVPVADTLKRVDAGGRIAGTVDRGGLWAAQTPQVFRRDWLAEAYAKRAELTVPITDDAQLLEACGRTVVVVTGSNLNFKITTKADLDLAEAVLKSRGANATSPPARAFGDEAEW